MYLPPCGNPFDLIDGVNGSMAMMTSISMTLCRLPECMVVGVD